MQLRWGRLIAAAVVCELVPILILVALVAMTGPADQASAQAYAERLGRWVGPIGGGMSVLLGAWWVARPTPSAGLQHGLVLGALTAAIDIGTLVAAGAPFEWLFVFSNLGRVVAGGLGGWARSSKPAPVAA